VEWARYAAWGDAQAWGGLQLSLVRTGRKKQNTAGWTPEFRERILADIAAKVSPPEICEKHKISIVQLGKLMKRESMVATARNRVDVKEAIENFRDAVWTRLPVLAMTLPDTEKTAEFLRKSANDLGDIGQGVFNGADHKPLFVLPEGSQVAIAIKTGGSNGIVESALPPGSESGDDSGYRGEGFPASGAGGPKIL
jgi:hypothetical protein